MINLQILRYYKEEQTEGDLYVFGEDNGILWTCKSLELAWKDNKTGISCIPEGTYKVVVRHSAKYKRHLHITDVESRSLILIHPANFVGSMNPRTGRSDLRGCVGVGRDLTDINSDGIRDLTASKATFKDLMRFFPNDDDTATLTVTSKNEA